MDYKEINKLTGKIDDIESLLKYPSKIEVVAKVPGTGYGTSIYDAASPMEIAVKMERDEAEFLLNEYRKLIEKKVDSLTKKSKE